MKYPISEKDIFPYRPKPFYFITTTNKEDLSYKEFYKALFELKELGLGGIVLFNKPINGFDKDNYLSEDWFEMVENAAKACRDLGLPMWINNAFDYPPGAVAGRIEKIAPHLKAKRIIMENGKPAVKDVDWGFPAFEEALSAELFIKLVYEEYKKHVGQYFGDPIIGFFTDTDNRRVEPHVLFDPNSIQRDLFPWCTDFEETFREKYGYDILPYMEKIIARCDIPQAVDYWEHAGVTAQRWFKIQHEWLTENGLLYTGHTTDSSPFLYKDTPRTSPLTEGRFSDLQQHLDYAGTDQELYAIDGGKHIKTEFYYIPDIIWGQELKTPKMTNFAQVRYDLRAKQAEAAAFMYGKKGVMCEMFAATNFSVEPHTLKHIAAYQLMQGVDFIVTHEYQHRYRTKTKFFAPPNFSPESMLKYALKPLNDELAANAYMLAKGQKVFPVVLIDPTEWVWRNTLRTEEYFEAFEKLNRLPYGFTICDTEKIIKGDFGFKAAVVAGFELDKDTEAALKEKGVTIITEKELDRLSEIISECNISYKGEGTPHFTRRVIDGEEFTFIANIEQTEPISGTVTAYGKTRSITLWPGDIRYISATYDDIEEAYVPKNAVKLESNANVRFDRTNLVTLDVFKCDGRIVGKTSDAPTLDFPFTLKNDLCGMTLCIPEEAMISVTGVKLDGKELYAVKGIRFEEDYMLYALGNLAAGEHCITLEKKAPLKYWDHLSLEGDFDVDVESVGMGHVIWGEYNFNLHAPESFAVTLSDRRTALSADESVATQGQPFYSGGVTYEFNADVDDGGEYMISFGDVRDVCDISVNSAEAVRIIKPPYSHKIHLEKGQNKISVTVYNSYANAMEGFLEPGGIIGGCFIEKI